MSFIKRGDDQKIKLVDPDELTPEQKELVKKKKEQEDNTEREDEREKGTEG